MKEDGGAERSAKSGEAAFDRTVGGAGAVGDFGERDALGVAGVDEGSVVFGKVRERGVEGLVPQGFRIFHGRRRIARPERAEFREKGGLASLAAGSIGGGAARGFGEPRPEGVVIGGGAQAADRAEESVLHCFRGGVFVSPRHDERVALEACGVPAVEFGKCGLIPGMDTRGESGCCRGRAARF